MRSPLPYDNIFLALEDNKYYDWVFTEATDGIEPWLFLPTLWKVETIISFSVNNRFFHDHKILSV